MAGTGGNVAHLAHLGGMIFGFFMIRYWQRHPSHDFSQRRGTNAFERMKNFYEKHRQPTPESPRGETRAESDWDYNARRKAEQDEVDRILDKIRKSGYDSLTREEKQRLFDQSKRQ
jgi:rhomboid family protein